jgi:hypothetical protein
MYVCMYVGKGPENNVVITNYFGRFSPIIGEKNSVFLETNVMINFLSEIKIILSRKRHFFLCF